MNLSILLALAALASLEHGPAGDASEAFTRLRLLQGSWRGTYTWTGARTESGKMTATYRLTGNGSALIEDLAVGEQPSMTSAYHLDKGDLRMTHYCGAGNQPRLKAGSIDLTKNLIRFDFVDITNLPTPDFPHVHGFTIRLVDGDHIELEFAFIGKGKESVEHIALTRIAAT
jgi:hypothetical protein